MNQQRGFSLIEALIALVVLSIGLIGVAAMQLKALQSATAGYQRSVASVAAVDAQERLWAQLATLNPGQACENIDRSAVEDVWKDDWFADNDQKPLRNAKEGESSIGRGSGKDKCRFNVILVLGDDENDRFDYIFRLPRLEVQ
ncbi:type IV pilus modification protein PilV [Halovibrio sp. HP20-50]|uniref:type IV pilus modification protein PilV n=1 Tax=Halovibrio sp. HP20-59 TaxID=3080275 RepID=UPI00294B03F3|nr:type IV pilus modification protein PilV [Halovibrio sp. HP20-59]MEA2120275.1 type IV pilus modification protein PilV [Halovibrio sp. HP20-59]